LTSLEDFLFGTPLYVEIPLPADMNFKATLAGYFSVKVDGHCPECGKQTTFTTKKVFGSSATAGEALRIKAVEDRVGFAELEAVCARNGDHRLNYWLKFQRASVMKVGQIPSLADIANDEASTYRKVLNPRDSSELHKAIGLAAHGVGIGSFVYLRRLFERLVVGRFEEFKGVEGWNEADFSKLRMNEKIEFLRGHLPSFLVENSKIYSILSLGIHELSDETCLAAFEPIKLSLKIILEDDKKKQEELELRRLAAAAISGFSPK
jgi:hypothetical protein